MGGRDKPGPDVLGVAARPREPCEGRTRPREERAMSTSTDEAAAAKFKTIQLVPNEAELRVQLAAAYRLVEHFGWNESIYGHLTLRVPGPERQLSSDYLSPIYTLYS